MTTPTKAERVDRLLAQLRAELLAPDAPDAPAGPLLAFEELWEPRTPQTGVFGVVSSAPLAVTPDGSDPEQPFTASTITGKWGTLAGMDGSTSLPNVTGQSATSSWIVGDGLLHFHASYIKTAAGHVTDGFALISGATFDRRRRLVAQAEVLLTDGTPGAFLELCLVAGEGDYRGMAYRRNAVGDTVNGVAPLQEVPLAPRGVLGWDTFRLEYDPAVGWRYMLNGAVIGTEPISHKGALLTADPHLGLYFTGAGPDSWAEGAVGAVRVWVD